MLLKGFDDVEVAPVGGRVVVGSTWTLQVELKTDLVDVLQIFKWESTQSWPLSALYIHLQDDVLASEVAPVDHVLEGLELPKYPALRLLVQTYRVEVTVGAIFVAFWLSGVGAVKLVVQNVELVCNLTSEKVLSPNAHVQHCDAPSFHEIGADGVTSVEFSPEPIY